MFHLSKPAMALAVGGAAGALLIAPGAQAGEVLDRIMESGTLTVSTDPAYPPQSTQRPDGTFEGFDIDVATALAERMGVEVEFVTPAWEIITAGNWGGRWDVSVGSMTPTEARAEVLDFPAIYYYTPASFVVHEDSEIDSIEDLDGAVIGVCGGCTYEFYLKENLQIDAQGVPEWEYLVEPGEIRTYETDTNVFDDLRIGPGDRLDAGMSALPTIQAAIDAGYPLRVVGDPMFYEPLSVAIDKGDEELAAEIVRIIDEMHADGTLSELSEKWYGVDITSVE
jgi:polar amino acid transport system substrate-binding protein